MKFEEKLKKFKAGTHVFHTPTQEIYDKLMVELEKRGYLWHNGVSMTKYSFTDSGHGRKDLCIQYNGFEDERVNCGYTKWRMKEGLEILELTMEDFKPTQTVITITSDGYRRVTAETNGYSAEALCCPTDTFSLTKGSHMALQRLLEKVKESAVEEPEFRVGDIVEIMGTDTEVLKESIGLQGCIVSAKIKIDGVYKVKLPVYIRGGNEFFYDDLKLIRRVNV